MIQKEGDIAQYSGYWPKTSVSGVASLFHPKVRSVGPYRRDSAHPHCKVAGRKQWPYGSTELSGCLFILPMQDRVLGGSTAQVQLWPMAAFPPPACRDAGCARACEELRQ